MRIFAELQIRDDEPHAVDDRDTTATGALVMICP